LKSVEITCLLEKTKRHKLKPARVMSAKMAVKGIQIHARTTETYSGIEFATILKHSKILNRVNFENRRRDVIA